MLPGRWARTCSNHLNLPIARLTTPASHGSATFPEQSQVVICGAGTVANSVAYHLVQSGWKDVLVLEKDRIGGGTSNFGSGTLGLFKPSADRHLISYSLKLYRQLQDQGFDVGLKQCGSLNLAQTKDRLIALKRRMSYNLPKGLHCEILSGPELRKLHPLLRTDDLVGAVWVPEDAVATPKAVCMVLANLAKKGGAKYIEGCEVKNVLTKNSRISGVQTSLGTVRCEYFVNCAGMIDNYFVAVGMNGNSLQGAGGIGKAVAEWITEGEPRTELLPFDVRRFLDLHNNNKYLRERIREVVGRHYSVLYPLQCEYKLGRGLRCSPLYGVLENSGAVFGTRMGYERPLYFDSTYQRGNPLPQMPPGTFGKPQFFNFMHDEFVACHEGVGICDMSSFTKMEIKGMEVVNYLQQLCSNDVNIPVGGIAHAGMQNERGGYENDCMLIRQTENSYFMVSPTNQQTRIFEWMRRHLPSNQSVSLNDVTSMYTVLNILGPKSQALMSELSNSDMHLHPFTYKKVNVGYASDVMVMAFTNTGEPGYSLYVPSEYALHVYDRLIKIGRDYGVRNVGYFTLRFLRIERFVPFWAEELDSLTTPYEVGRGYKVKLDKEYFVGKFALQKQKAEGVFKRLVMFHLEGIDPDRDVWPWGGEPVYRNDEYVGSVTSAGLATRLLC
ncbi:hypothetical protein B566_EDAN015620 [Ephemera danica]|nr:hypothetical protein B566_EDAN015620 [Ephemera danica]